MHCPSCGAAAAAGTSYCGACGAPLQGVARGPRRVNRYLPWVLGGAVVVTLLAALFQPAPIPQPAAAPDQSPPAGSPPDISALTPRQRFDRLYTRVIDAAQKGDQATVEQFTPMALAAFGMLETVDADARYHLAMLQLHIGDLAGAAAQADSIKQSDPLHLFSYVVSGAVARWTKNADQQAEAYRGFLTRYDAEMKADRPEYRDHRAMLAEVYQTATGSGR